jgi:hypothetical protein
MVKIRYSTLVILLGLLFVGCGSQTTQPTSLDQAQAVQDIYFFIRQDYNALSTLSVGDYTVVQPILQKHNLIGRNDLADRALKLYINRDGE